MNLTAAKRNYTTIKSKVETEKSYNNLEFSTYTFLIDPNATKQTVRLALTALYPGIVVDKVRTISRKGKVKKTRRGFSKRADRKFAIVRIKANETLLENLQVNKEGELNVAS